MSEQNNDDSFYKDTLEFSGHVKEALEKGLEHIKEK